jgi:hypothetical protein
MRVCSRDTSMRVRALARRLTPIAFQDQPRRYAVSFQQVET